MDIKFCPSVAIFEEKLKIHLFKLADFYFFIVYIGFYIFIIQLALIIVNYTFIFKCLN